MYAKRPRIYGYAFRTFHAIAFLILSACEVQFQHHITPLVIGTIQATPAFGSLATQIPIELIAAQLPDPEEGTREELLYWSEQLGFGRDGKPTIDELFNPYRARNPVSDDLASEAIQILAPAAAQLYQEEGGVLAAANNYIDNPLSYYQEDPLLMLEGEERALMAYSIMSCHDITVFSLLLKRIKANESIVWNYEPSWLWAKMKLHPRELLKSQFEFLWIYASDPKTYEFLEEMSLFGTVQ